MRSTSYKFGCTRGFYRHYLYGPQTPRFHDHRLRGRHCVIRSVITLDSRAVAEAAEVPTSHSASNYWVDYNTLPCRDLPRPEVIFEIIENATSVLLQQTSVLHLWNLDQKGSASVGPKFYGGLGCELRMFRRLELSEAPLRRTEPCYAHNLAPYSCQCKHFYEWFIFVSKDVFLKSLGFSVPET